MKARVFVRLGRLGEALAWARSQDLSAEDELTYVREFEHITLARLLLAQGCAPEALALLDRLLRAAHEGGRLGSAIEILALQALARQSRGQMHAALVPLERALRLAEPEGYARVFVDEGAPMAVLPQAAARQEIAPKYVRQLLVSVGEAQYGATSEHGLIEALSERELEVLRLLASELDGPDIARELTVSLSTMRTHTRSIFNKLEVNNRRAAVRRAQEIGLL